LSTRSKNETRAASLRAPFFSGTADDPCASRKNAHGSNGQTATPAPEFWTDYFGIIASRQIMKNSFIGVSAAPKGR
jgi:hypothetical protein